MAYKIAPYLLTALAVLLMGCFSGCVPAGEDQPEDVVRPVKVMQIKKPSPEINRVLPGRITPQRETRMSFRVANELQSLEVDTGDYVYQGQVVARLDPRDFRLAVQNFEGSLGEARSNLKAMQEGARTEDVISLEAELRAAGSAVRESQLQYSRHIELYEQGAVARAELDRTETALEEARGRKRHLEMELQKALLGARDEDIQAMKSRIKSLEAALEEARSALNDSVLRAPFSGYIAEKHVEKHENISAGQPVATLQDLTRVEVKFGLPEQLVIQKDDIKDVYCILDAYPGFPLPARLKEVSPDARELSYQATAILTVPENIRALPSMAAQVHINIAPDKDGEQLVTIPETALFTDNMGQDRVWVYDSGTSRVQSRQVRTGELTSTGVQVLSGLGAGDLVVTAGAHFVQEGQKVRPLE
ncbi:efflux RND transporter periplasmic adaptor subunit [Desulfonatronospira sp.]|uniref:efflux RND transporter periplasmic adaptor subunit n=1 Tax=Desulfonatronospira sp. TaxID=1962951 RepID=UPI0025C60F24|nr:efflux RND transporter periplasmic adaptor subunit [Desulfonatronospira sp.]